MAVHVTDRSIEWSAKVTAICEKSLAHAAGDINRLATAGAPHKTGTLWRSIQDKPNGPLSYSVSASAPYARRWEYNEPLTDSLGRHYGSASFHSGGDHYMRNAARVIIPIWTSGAATYWNL